MLLLFANLFVRSALILGTAALLCRLFSQLRPAQRHRILLTAFLLLSLWPLLAALLPEITLPLEQRPLATATVTVQQVVRAKRSAPSTEHSFIPSLIAIWASLAGLALAPWLLAHLRLRALVTRSVVSHNTALLHELSAQLNIAHPPALLIHPGPIMPMASGLIRPSIILPATSHEWSPKRLRIVLLHELAHIARRDLLSLYFARVLAAAWWFQPLTWAVLRLLRRESEQACDELVIASGIRPSDYAAELLAIAQSFTTKQRVLAPGIAMARQDNLQSRLQSILGGPQAQISRPSKLLTVSLFCLTALTFAVSAVTLPPIPNQGQIMKKQSLLAGLLAAAGLSAATISGSLYDPSGAAVPNAKAVLYDPDTNTKFETTTTADGKFSFETLPPGQYILRVQSPGFTTLFREFNVKSDTKIERGFTFAHVSDEATPTDQKRIRVAGETEEANLVKKVQPIYPPAAKAAGVQGKVDLEMVVSKEGAPLDIRVLSSPSDDLTQSALEAVRQWRYKPTLLNGDPVEIVTEVSIHYTLLK